MLTVGSLFSGAGLLDAGLTSAGFEHKWFCEIDPYCRDILKKRWPEADVYEDVRTLGVPPSVDVIAAGFPCTDISVIGKRAGIGGAKSGLWSEAARIIRELRPQFVIVENVPSLLVRGVNRVLGDLAASGYDAEWDCYPAAAFGAPHVRARVWLVAYPVGFRNRLAQETVFAGRQGSFDNAWWETEPAVCRVDDGSPNRVDRLRALGNGVVAPIAEHIGRMILEAA